MREIIRILHTQQDLSIGGGQQLLLRDIVAMNAYHRRQKGASVGFEHIVCGVLGGGEMEERYRSIGVETVILQKGGLLTLIRNVLRLRRLCMECRIDLVHTDNTASDKLYGQLTAMVCRLPVVNMLHAEPRGPYANPGKARQGPLPSRLKQGIRNWLTYLTTRQFIAVSEPLRVAWTPYLRFLGRRDSQITVITPALETSSYRSDGDEIRALRVGIAGEDAWPVLMDVARLVTGKGLESLPGMMKSVLARHPQAKLVLVGDGKLRPVIEAAAQEHGISSSVVLLGQRHDVPKLLQACDIFVFPSRSEGFGLAVLEAMAAAKPIVAFGLPALMGFVEPGSGILVPPGDEPGFVGAVLALLGDRKGMAEMGQQGRRIVEERFGMRKRMEMLADVYRAALPGSRRPAEKTFPGFHPWRLRRP
jgi:glycosyltransferase involved in cell wall biosynthesis